MNDVAPMIEIEVPARAEFVRIVRLVVAGVGNLARFNLEEIEDLKVAVGEACYTTFQGVRSPDARVRIFARPLGGDTVEVQVVRPHLPDEMLELFPSEESADKGIGFILLKHLVDEVSFRTGRRETRIELTKRREPVAAGVAPPPEMLNSN